jgi:hypothetical protein
VGECNRTAVSSPLYVYQCVLTRKTSRVLKGALPKDETARPPKPRLSPPGPSPAHVHSFDESHATELDHWTLPSHSSSIRTRQISTHDANSDRPQSFTDPTQSAFRDNGAAKYDADMPQVSPPSAPASFDKHGHRLASRLSLKWLTDRVLHTRDPAWGTAQPSRAHFTHLQNQTYTSL